MGKLNWKRCNFNCWRNVERITQERTLAGRLLQIVGACHTWALLKWWLTKRCYIKCTYLYLCCCSWKTSCRLWNSTIFCIQRLSRCLCRTSTDRRARSRWPSLRSGFIWARRHRTNDCNGQYQRLSLITLSMNTSGFDFLLSVSSLKFHKLLNYIIPTLKFTFPWQLWV